MLGKSELDPSFQPVSCRYSLAGDGPPLSRCRRVLVSVEVKSCIADVPFPVGPDLELTLLWLINELAYALVPGAVLVELDVSSPPEPASSFRACTAFHLFSCFLYTRRRAMMKKIIATSPEPARDNPTPIATTAPRLSRWLDSADSVFELSNKLESETESAAADPAGLFPATLRLSDTIGSVESCTGVSSVETSEVSLWPSEVTAKYLGPVSSEMDISKTAVTAEGEIGVDDAEEGRVIGAANTVTIGGDASEALLRGVRSEFGGVAVLGS